MTTAQWKTSVDPQAMIQFLVHKRGNGQVLWDFTSACLRRIHDQLPGDEFRRVVRHFEQVGIVDLDERLDAAGRVLRKLEIRAEKCHDDAELIRLNQQIGLGQMVFALEFQAPEEAAADISKRLIEWAPQPEVERQIQSETLRRLLPEAIE